MDFLPNKTKSCLSFELSVYFSADLSKLVLKPPHKPLSPAITRTNSLFESTEYELTWLNQTSSSIRVVIDGENLSQALHLLHDLIQERNQTVVKQN